MPTIKIANGKSQITSDTFIQAKHHFKCQCGTELTLTLNWPEGLTLKTDSLQTKMSCPKCGRPIVLGSGSYSVRNYELIQDDKDAPSPDSAFSINVPGGADIDCPNI